MTSALMSNRYSGLHSDSSRRRHLSSNTVTNQGEQLIQILTLNRLREHDHVEDNVVLGQLEAESPRDNNPEFLREIGRAYRYAADRFENDETMQSIISKVSPEMKDDILNRVAKNLLGGGQLSWGKILVFFYFAYKLCSKALNSIRRVLSFCVQFMRDNIVGWVIEHGGWEAFSESAMSVGKVVWSKPMLLASMLVGAAAGGYFFYRKLQS